MNLNFIKIAKYFYELRQNLKYEEEKELYSKLYPKLKNIPFYRLEKNGLGPWNQFRNNLPDEWIDSDFRRGLERDSSFLCDVWSFSKAYSLHACYSIDNLKQWFSSSEWEKLFSQGYEIKKYYIKKDFQDIFFGDNQVLLLKDPNHREIILNKTKLHREKESKFFDEFILDLIR